MAAGNSECHDLSFAPRQRLEGSGSELLALNIRGETRRRGRACFRCGRLLISAMSRERRAHAKKLGFEPIDLAKHERLGELVADVLSVPVRLCD